MQRFKSFTVGNICVASGIYDKYNIVVMQKIRSCEIIPNFTSNRMIDFKLDCCTQ